MEIFNNSQLENIDGEIWGEVDGFNGDYFVSNFGRIKSFKKWPDIIILKQCKDKCGYLYVNLYKNTKVKNKKIHILMFETFNNYKLKDNECIHHIDFTKDNYLHNFQLITKFEHNELHKNSEKTKKIMSIKKIGKNNPMCGKHHSDQSKELMKGKNLGENHSQSILKEKDIIKIRKLSYEGILTQKEIGKLFNVDRSTISDIKLRKTWKHI